MRSLETPIIYQSVETLSLNSTDSGNQQELVLFEALLKLDAGSYLTGNEVNDLLDLYGKSLESQRKVRMNVINQLNLKIKQKFNINDAVQRIDDPSDKRYRLYFLNPRLLSMLKKSR
jgi:hypothetical protein